MSLKYLEVGVLDRHDARLHEELLRLVVDQLHTAYALGVCWKGHTNQASAGEVSGLRSSGLVVRGTGFGVRFAGFETALACCRSTANGIRIRRLLERG